MTTRNLIAVLLSMFTLMALVPGTPAQAACAPDPNALSFREMIKKQKTGIPSYDYFFVGKVVDIKDLKPGKGGKKLAKLVVGASATGRPRLVARVHFWKPKPSPGGVPVVFNFQRRHFYAVVADRRKDGTFVDDAGECGRTLEISRDRFWNLVRFDRHH